MRRIGIGLLVALGAFALFPAEVAGQQRQKPSRPQPAAPSPGTTQSANWIMPGCRALVAGRDEVAFRQGVCLVTVVTLTEYVGCAPPQATGGQVVRVVATYIDGLPARLHEDFVVLAREALL